MEDYFSIYKHSVELINLYEDGGVNIHDSVRKKLLSFGVKPEDLVNFVKNVVDEEFGGEDVNDVLNLIPMAAGLPYADTSRVGMYGFNRGGMMTYLAMTRSKQIDAAISESGISNLYLYAAIHTEDGFYESMEKMMPDYYSDKSGSMKKRSMAYWADNLLSDIPLLILHGSSDWDVHPSESQSASESLFKIRYPHRSILYEGGTNGLPEFKEEKNLEIHKWLDRYVRDQKKFPSIRNLERR